MQRHRRSTELLRDKGEPCFDPYGPECCVRDGMAMIDIPTEDRLAMARRHVEDGEGYVARQEALIAELERNEHAKLAVEARALLTALETSLRLMREDLARIEKESRRSGGPD
jgi:hypothetical protein